jgi:hypothetical protein
MGMISYQGDLAEFKQVLEGMMNEWYASTDDESEDEEKPDF